MPSRSSIKSLYQKVGVLGLSKKTSKKKTSAILKRIIPYLTKSDKILDLGCGYGRIAIPLQLQGYNVYGVDISENLLKHAKTQSSYPEKFKLGSTDNLPYKTNSFDKIICLWSVWNEVLTNHLASLDEMYRVLKKNGKVIIDIINADTLFMKFILFLSHTLYKTKNPYIWTTKLKHKDKYYIVQYFLHTQKSLRVLIKKSRFKSFSFKKHNIYGKDRLFIILNK
jgi:ubiquinone/menaquinone biosynthesis C-methylase UbiE